MARTVRHRIFEDGEIVARSKVEAKRRVQDKLYHSHPNHVVEDGSLSVWLKDGLQLRTERTRWWEYNCILIPRRKQK